MSVGKKNRFEYSRLVFYPCEDRFTLAVIFLTIDEKGKIKEVSYGIKWEIVDILKQVVLAHRMYSSLLDKFEPDLTSSLKLCAVTKDPKLFWRKVGKDPYLSLFYPTLPPFPANKKDPNFFVDPFIFKGIKNGK